MVGWNKRAVLICVLSLVLLSMGCIREAKGPIVSITEEKTCMDIQEGDILYHACEFDSAPAFPEQATDLPPSEHFPESPKPADNKAPTPFSTLSTATTSTSLPMTKPNSNILKATFFKSPARCRCCDKYFDYVAAYGYQVEVVETTNMADIRSDYQIPHDLESCHTAVFGDYIVEGHVPIEAIKKLLSDRPDIDGIALPGEPYGAPGNRGAKTSEFTIYAFSDGEMSVFMIL